jgi:ABC-type arginine transport system permease subunit
MPEEVSTANAAVIVPRMMRAAIPPMNFLLQLLFNSFSFFL